MNCGRNSLRQSSGSRYVEGRSDMSTFGKSRRVRNRGSGFLALIGFAQNLLMPIRSCVVGRADNQLCSAAVLRRAHTLPVVMWCV